jgi:RimJ/RimL family protein N-acetyltransferase
MQADSLQTDRLTLRLFRESDLDDYAAMCADPEVMRYLGEGKTFSRAEAWRSMAAVMGHWHFRGYGLWAVEERVSGELVGRVGCWFPEGWPDFEVGWMLRRQSWGQGYATEAARVCLEYAFRRLQRDRVISLIQPGNAASIRVAERLGERQEGTAEVMGRDCLVYAIRRVEWEAMSPR